VLLHEIGHHILQQHKGKRRPRIARTRDHEAFAARFAEKHRAKLLERRRSQT
jgi:Zn-dependent peptidase ImmA (M78 family)